jgi:hypothetical protein
VPVSLAFEEVVIICLLFFFLSLASVMTIASALAPECDMPATRSPTERRYERTLLQLSAEATRRGDWRTVALIQQAIEEPPQFDAQVSAHAALRVLA